MGHLKSYKYQSVDKSFISNYILKHYWNGAVKLLPKWLAPNMVTLLGFFCILINVLFLQIFMPDLVGPGPSWLYYSFALGLWMYSTMDNIDGKQARRTGTSSGLGELFDHGIDSLNCTLASLCETAAMGLGPSKTGAFTALVPCLPMFFSTWETYHTHTLYLGAFNGPTEGLIIACLVMVISGYLGPQIWQYHVADYLGYPEIFGGLTFRDLWVPIILFAFVTAHLPSCIWNVAQARRKNNLPLWPVFLEWTPMLVFTASCAAWIGSPYSVLLRENHLVIFCLTLSFVFGRLTTKIILHHLTRRPFPYFTVQLVPLAIGAIMAWSPLFGFDPLPPALERWYIYAYFVFAMTHYFVWAVRVINRICEVLDINCLTIKKKKVDSKEADGFVHEQKGKSTANSNGHLDVRKTKKEL
ncbi:putative CDP-alcohol phosphatidyltransferase class-I family protein C22A12.10 [Exophiala dermatitidis]